MYVVERVEDRKWVLPLYYEKLSRFMTKDINLPAGAVILEGGPGKGNMTLPLLSLMDRNYRKYICYDLNKGPYEGGLEELSKRLSVMGFSNIEIKEGDVREMKDMPDNSVDIVIANELLCELTRDGVQQALAEFFRVLKPGGQVLHGELSPIPENESQKMAIMLDQLTSLKVFPREWFSPPADELITWLHKAGFTQMHIRYFEETIKFKGEAARLQVEEWLIEPEALEKLGGELHTHEMELPMSQIVHAFKPIGPK